MRQSKSRWLALGISVTSSHALHGNAKEHEASVINAEGSPVQSHLHWNVFTLREKKLSPIALLFKAHLLTTPEK